MFYTRRMFGEGIKLPSANNADVGVLLAIMMAVGFAIAAPLLGVWEAVRGFAIEAVILGATFYIARRWLPWEDAARERIQHPRTELFIAGFGFAFFYFAWPYFSGALPPESMFLNGMFANILLGVMIVTSLLVFRYPGRAWGLRWPTGRELLVLVAVAIVAVGISQLAGSLLPQSEVWLDVGPARPFVPGSLLWHIGAATQNATSAPAVPLLTAVFLLSVIGQELYFRVYLQTRLAHIWPGRWALFWQAVLYWLVAFIPLFFLSGQQLQPSFLLTQAAVLTNGVLAGYFWRKTGSLPLLILLHILMFTRWGL
jgi:membrane protease YdiL (CAAX protease family)